MAGKLILKIAAGCLTLTLIGGISAVIGQADELSDYEKRQKELDRQAQQYQSILDQTQNSISQKEEYKEALLNKISTLNEQIANGRGQIGELEQQISEMQGKIDGARNDISGRMDLLKKRLKAIYLSGETTSLEIILGAKSFEDFLDKVDLVSYMSNSDKKMINLLESEIQEINDQKDELSGKKTELDEEQKKLDDRQQELTKLLAENQEVLNGLYTDNASAQDHLDENTAERQEVEDAIKAYYADKARQEEASRIASEAQKKLEESRLAAESKAAESKKNESEKEAQNNSSQNTTTSEYESDYTSSEYEEVSSYIPSRPQNSSAAPAPSRKPEPEPEPPVSSEPDEPIVSSGYVWPVPGHYTLSSVWNEDRDSYNHGAIDISDGSVMNAEIVAAESGTVVLSNDYCPHNYPKEGSCGCGGGYGIYCMIDHGNGKATLYAHMSSILVSSGTYVQKGQVIGYVGTTGWSTGPHLHFETRLNGEKYNPMTEYPNM